MTPMTCNMKREPAGSRFFMAEKQDREVGDPLT